MNKTIKIFLAFILLSISGFIYSRYDLINEKVIHSYDSSTLDQSSHYICQDLNRYVYCQYFMSNNLDPAEEFKDDKLSDQAKDFFRHTLDSIAQEMITTNDYSIKITNKANGVSFKNNRTIADPIISATITFDHNGNITFSDSDLQNFYYANGFKNLYYSYLNEYYYDYLDYDEMITYETKEFSMNKIKDMEIEISMLSPLNIESSYSYYSSTNFFIPVLFTYTMVCLGILFVIMMVIPYRYLTSNILEIIGNVKFAILGSIWIVIVWFIGWIDIYAVEWTTNSRLYSIFKYLGIENSYNYGKVIVNVLLWFIFYACFAFLFYMVKYLFHKGIKKYLLENTLVVWLYMTLRRVITQLTRVDFSKSTIQFSVIVSTINFIILSVVVTIMFMSNAQWYFGIWIIVLACYSMALGIYLHYRYVKLQNDHNVLLQNAKALSVGRFNQPIEEDVGLFNPLRDQFNNIQESFETAVQEEVKSTNMKTELITNVSHDLKTPLTSLITYIDLLKDENLSEDQQKEYINILDHSALRLKNMVQDLFDVSKANSGNLEVNKEQVDLVSFIKQVGFECEDALDTKNLSIIYRMPDKFLVEVDLEKTYRIFENLYMNISKYALENTRVYIDIIGRSVVFKNVSKNPLDFDTTHIVDRFVQGDASRNMQGSGLGLAIVKSFMEIQGYSFKVETDGDLFKAVLIF